MEDHPRISHREVKGRKSPYDLFMESLDRFGDKVQGIFTTWLAKQTTCEYMLWNYIVDFYETGEIIHEDTEYSAKGNEIHNLLAFGTPESNVSSSNQWRSMDELAKYQQDRLGSTFQGRITEYSLVGEIGGLKVRGTIDAFDLESGTLIEIKTRARATIPYVHERKNKMQLLTYYYLIKNYNTQLNDPSFPAVKLSDYAKIQYYYQADQRLLGELVIHVPYEMERYRKTLEYFKEFWHGNRPPAFALKYCMFCKYTNNCYYHKRYYRHAPSRSSKNRAPDD